MFYMTPTGWVKYPPSWNMQPVIRRNPMAEVRCPITGDFLYESVDPEDMTDDERRWAAAGYPGSLPDFLEDEQYGELTLAEQEEEDRLEAMEILDYPEIYTAENIAWAAKKLGRIQ
jgi:hypothetical protein